MSESYTDWIIKVVLDDCVYTGLDFEDREVREAVVEGLRNAADYLDALTKPMH
jgi:hypothetical protein|tara:strand:+ start:199 stop:357 length:159 start_codon:yes stop_codon:yes gene_type:complete